MLPTPQTITALGADLTIFMIRVLLVLVFMLSSCVSFDLGYIDIVREAFKKNNINNLDPFVKNRFSFIRLTKDNNQAILVLSEYDNGLETWIGAGEETLKTTKGVILFSDGLKYNVQQHRPDLIQENIYLNNFSTFTSFDNPDLNYVQTEYIKYSAEKKLKSLECNGTMHLYKRIISSIRYSDDLISCLDSNKVVIFSVQKLHPWDEPVTIEFFYQ